MPVLKRNVSELSEDCWGPWGENGIKVEQQEPVATKIEEGGDAQPRHWHNWQSPSGTVHTAHESAESDGGTGSDTWRYNHPWDGSWQSQSWQGAEHWSRGSSDSKQTGGEFFDAFACGKENADLMDTVEKDLNDLVSEMASAAGSDKTTDRVAEAKLKMGKRDLRTAQNLEEGLQLLASGNLDKKHKALQAARRDPTFKKEVLLGSPEAP